VTVTITYCANGCTTRGQHDADCDGLCSFRGYHHRKHEACCGCAPRHAEYGNLCAWCWQRLCSDVAAAPALVQHLREVGEPHAGRKPMSDDVRSPNDPAEADMLSAAIDAADEIHAGLASWAMLVLEEREGVEDGPDQTDWWQSRTHTKTDPETGELYVSHRRPVGIRKPDDAATRRLVAWLTPHLPWCAERVWAAEMRSEIASMIATTTARWPTTDYRTRPVTGVACARCHQRSLTYTPTTYYRAQFKVTCTNPECGRIYTEDEWDATIAKLTIERGRIA